MTDQPIDIPDDLIVPLEQGSPDPYGEGVKQDEVTDDNKVEGLGGDTFPESPLNVGQALLRLHQLVESHATVDWNGNQIRGYCLRIQHDASEIGALHATAIDDWNDNPDQHPCTYETVDWSKVPRGAFVYNKSGSGGSGAGHIYRYCGMHKGKPLFVSNDIIPGQMSYINDPTWFRLHWGQELVGWSRVCNSVWQKGLPGNQQQGGGDGKGGGHWPGVEEAARKLWAIRGLLFSAKHELDALGPDWPEIRDAREKTNDALIAVVHARTELHKSSEPKKK